MVTRQPVKAVKAKEEKITEDLSFIKDIASSVNEALKRDAIMLGNDAGSGDLNVPYWIKTGIPQLDFAVGGMVHPGFPGARLIEVYGAEGSGKSTLAVWLTKMAMEQENAIAYYQDAERVLTPEIVKGTGIDMNKVMLEQPDILEDVFDAQEATLRIIQSKNLDVPVVITLDSVASCSTKTEIEGDMDDVQMAPHARLMSKGLRKIKSYITDSKVLSIWVNQIREKIGQSYGDTDATFGGKALKFYASVRIKLAKVKTLKKSSGDPYGCTIQVKVVKNKVAPPLKVIEYDILFVQDKNGSYPRIDVAGAILDWCKDHELIGGGSGRYEVEGKSMYKDQARKMLLDDPKLFDKYQKLAYSVTLTEEE